MGQLSFQYPQYYLLLSLLVAIAGALILYYKSTSLHDRPEWQRFLLSVVRGLSLLFLCLLLLNPILKRFQTEIKKPQTYIAIDQSESMLNQDSNWFKQYTGSLENAKKVLSEKYDIKTLYFASDVSSNAIDKNNAKRTSIDNVFQKISDEADPQLLKSVILLSDGIYNSGKNPYYNRLTQMSPIYTLFHGDSTQEKDILIQREYHNEIIYSGDKFACQFDLQAWKAKDEQIQFILERQEGNVWNKIEEFKEKIDKDNFFITKEIVHNAGNPGIYKYRARLSKIDGERNINNNSRQFFIEVLDAKKKILFYALGPHPDLSAIKTSLESNKNYQVDIKFAPAIPDKVESYNLVIFHQLPTSTQNINLILNRINASKTARIFMLGQAVNLSEFNKSQDLIKINGSGNSPNEAQAIYHTNFNLFTLSDQTINIATNFPPINAIFGNYELNSDAYVLFHQRIGKIDTKYPLILLKDYNGIKSGIICGEGIWKWKFNNYSQTSNFEAFNEIISKIIQYSSNKEDRRKFKASPNKNVLSETESLIFNAELYNDSYERVNNSDVRLEIKSNDSKNYEFNLGKKENYYELNIGTLSPGEYSYSAKTTWNNKTLNSDGRFTVQEEDIELNNLVARPDLLRGIAEKSGGKSFDKSEINSLTEILLSEDKNKPIHFQNLDIRQIIDHKWLLIILIILLSTEWFLRRYWGSY
ncbi:MAG: hypothetical protein IT267_03335 [Saprospiraceae bacterium]|nr:hypothetical protein [Saprospiraceae bacterium]